MVLAESSVSRPSRYASFDTSARPRSGCYEEDRGGAGHEVAAAAGEEPTSHSSHTDWQDVLDSSVPRRRRTRRRGP